ncbi:MAG TPA: histidine kinase, partial [Chitinophagaceae bacterium]|nr:histidine kinase [Chitinophagaceae bacterium]
DYLKKANTHFQKAGDEEGESEASTWLCSAYLEGTEKPDIAFEYCKRTIALSRIKRVHHLPLLQIFGTMSFVNMSQIFESAGDYETAMDYLRQGREYDREYNTYWDMGNVIGMLFCKMNIADSALYYLKINYEADRRKRPKNKIILGIAYLLSKDYDLALPLFKSAVDSLRTAKSEVSLPWGLINLAKAYEGKGEYKTALKHAQEGFHIAVKRYRTNVTMEGANVLSRLFHQVKKNDSAYHYLNYYTALKDSANNKQNLWKLNIKLSEFKKEAEDAKKEARLGFLNRDNKIKEQQLKQEATFKYFLIAAFIALVFAGLYVFRNLSLKRKNEKLKQDKAEKEWAFQKLESEKKQLELQRQAAELEMQALRAQMNPHFIFNCLSSINRIIMKNDSQSASDYLTRFSRLMRMVLINSQRAMIPLEDELQMLRLYLDMERLRFKDSFNYSIIFTNTIDEGAVFVPPLLLQPFCENAIWHGLMQKDGAGLLTVELSMRDNFLNCIITDNGIGREKAKERKSKTAESQKSMGLKITTERLALLNREKGLYTFYEIEDLKDESGNAAGTRVVLKIGLKETVEETA